MYRPGRYLEFFDALIQYVRNYQGVINMLVLDTCLKHVSGFGDILGGYFLYPDLFQIIFSLIFHLHFI